jgi:hypothetical protein
MIIQLVVDIVFLLLMLKDVGQGIDILMMSAQASICEASTRVTGTRHAKQRRENSESSRSLFSVPGKSGGTLPV